MNFAVELLSEAEEFLDTLDERTRTKVLYNIRKAQEVQDQRLFKKLNRNIWEFRTFYNRKTLRLFAFWDKRETVETLVICTHGITKKSDKTPKKEIAKAEQIRRQYLK
jgi:phage-related protein